jgi:hypothetical protein
MCSENNQNNLHEKLQVYGFLKLSGRSGERAAMSVRQWINGFVTVLGKFFKNSLPGL